jgi:hypothetical protein
MPAQLVGLTCCKGCGRQARALSDLCGLCYAGATALERVLDAWEWATDSFRARAFRDLVR